MVAVQPSSWSRLFRHVWTTRRHLRQVFPGAALDRIQAAVAVSELGHGGEVRIALEAALSPQAVWHGLTPRQRARQVFSELEVWDTAANNGVLIYLLLADQAIEIVADRALDTLVESTVWVAIVQRMRDACAAGNFEQAAVQGIEATAELLGTHFPRVAGDRNELPDRPIVL